MTSMHSRFVTLESGVKLHYLKSGSGEVTLLFVPGWTMTTEVFCHQTEFFKDSSQYTFITFDPRSHGKSDKTLGGNNYEQHAVDLHQFITALDLSNIVLCGWSFATLETLAYVRKYGSAHLIGFIMLDGPPKARGVDNETEWVTYRYDDKDGIEEFFTMGKLRNPRKTDRAFAEWMLEDKSEGAIEWIEEMTAQTPNEVAAILNATAAFLDYEDDLIKISLGLPVWAVVRESQGPVVSNWCARNLENYIVSSFGEHMMFWERPHQFNKELVEFLKQI